MKKTTNLLSVAAALLLGTSLFANPLGQQVVKVEKADSKPTIKVDGSPVLNATKDHTKFTARGLFTNNEVEMQILSVRTAAFSLHDKVVELLKMKDNQVKDDVQNFKLGADKDTRDILGIVAEMLNLDEATHSEHDRKAINMLNQEVKTLTAKLVKVEKAIEIASSGYALPKGAEVSVMGTSKIQAVPLMDGKNQIGHYRVVCGGTDSNDIIQNSKLFSYCAADLYVNATSRSHDLSNETIEMHYVGIAKYRAGIDRTAEIVWIEEPKRSIMPYVEQYNLDNIPGAVDALTWNSTITLSNGTKFPGKNAMVEK